MALTDNLLKMLDYVKYGYSGKLLTIGVQELVLSSNYKKKIKAKYIGKKNNKILSSNLIFKKIGFSEINTLDYPGMDNSDIELDLNTKLPKKHFSKYNFVLDAGFMEHVFNVPEMMKSLHNLLKPGGKIVHFNPCQGSMNHGFYNFQPTFYFSYYKSCNYKNIKVFLVESKISNNMSEDKVTQIHENINNMNYFPKSSSSTYILTFATKTLNSSFKMPNQEFYQNIFNEKKKLNGKRIPNKKYQKIVGNTKKNNHKIITKKSFYI